MSDLISRQDAIETVKELNAKVNDDRYETICTLDVLRRIESLPSAEGGDAKMTVIPEGTGLMQPCPDNGADLISRQDAIEAVAKLQKYDLDERNRLRIYAPWHKPKRIFVETEAIYKTIYTIPSAEAEPSLKAIKRQIDEHWYLDPPSDEATIGNYPNDLISRSALMEYCSNQKSKSIDNNDIARFPSAEAVHGWIPYSERLPDWKDMVEGVIITTENGRVTFADYCTENGTFHDVGQDVWASDIIAWMPLPKPYKGGENE